MSKNIESMFDEMLNMTAEDLAKEEVTEEEEVKVKTETKNLLQKFLKYIKSERFVSNCKAKSSEFNVDYTIVKNAFIRGLLEKIANILNLAIAITAQLVMYVVEFISAIISKIVHFTVSACRGIINLLTLNCGTQPA